MYKKKKKQLNKKIIITIAVIFLLIIGFIINSSNVDKQLSVFEKTIKDSVLTIQKTILYPIEFIKTTIETNKEKENIYNKYKELEQQLNENDFLKNEIEELNYELNTLKNILEINNTFSDKTLINATVISKDLTYFNETIIIDKGQKDGIEEGMAVMVKDGLIGKVISTSYFNSTIRLLTAGIDKVSVKIQTEDGYSYGILNKYNIENDTYIIEGISQSVEITESSNVTTTGLGSIYPSGILIGQVTAITTDEFDLAKVLEVKSSVDFQNINYVTVLKRGLN